MDKILLIDDEADVQYSFGRIFDSSEIELTTASSGEEGLKKIPLVKPDLVIMDIRMGGSNGLETLRRLRQTDAKLPVIMMTAYGSTQAAIEAMKLGAYDYLLKPFDVPKLKQTVAAALNAARAMREVVSYQPLLEAEDYDLGIGGRSESLQNVLKLIGQLSASDATALITGESGTGKELVARAIYHHSQRATQSFLALNCAAIPENLLESELFGHEKGAFTGATAQRIGRFEVADGGTIFLDEIADMSPPLQAKLLRVTQEGRFNRVGSNKELQTNARILVATNRHLEEEVKNGRFREDLFYRLNVVELNIAPLRERREDIMPLASAFISEFSRGKARFAASVIDCLAGYGWPGNVRELRNAMERAALLSGGELILSEHLPAKVRQGAQPAGPAEPVDAERLGEIERQAIFLALRKHDFNRTETAKALGISRRALLYKLQRFRELGYEVDAAKPE